MTGTAPAGSDREAALATRAAEPGLVLGRYRPLGPVDAAARSRMAALDTSTERQVMIKAGSDVRALRREAEALAAITDRGVVRLLDWHADGDHAVLVLEWLDGLDLESFVRDRGGRLDGATAAPILARLADAVGAIHQAGLLHRDLKPANVMLRDGHAPVIVDLGAALPLGPGSDPLGESELTEGYAAPEQYLTGQPEGPWTDVYGLAAIGHRTLVGRAPPSAMARLDGSATIAAIDAPGDWPLALRRAIDWGLALAPSARPASASAWRHAWAAGDDADAPGTHRGTEPPPIDDYPATIRVERRPYASPSEPMAGPAPAARPARRGHPVRTTLVGLLLLAILAGLGAAAWQAWPLYERHFKRAWLVDPAGGGDATTIADALARAGDGAIIRIAPGTYRESLRVAREVHLVAAEPEQPPVVSPAEGACIDATASAGSVSGLVLRSPPADPATPPVACVILRGDVTLAESEIQGAAGAAIEIRAGAEPLIRGNHVSESAGAGVVVSEGARGRIVANTIEGVGGSSVIVRGGSAPEIVDNTIEASGSVVFAEGATGSFEGNRLNGSRGSAIQVRSGAAPILRDNAIASAEQAAIFVYDHGGGRIVANRIEQSGLSGVVIAGGDVELDGNQIRGSGEHGILIVEHGRARLIGNQVTGSARHGIAIAPDAEATLEGNQLETNLEPQLLDGRPPAGAMPGEPTP